MKNTFFFVPILFFCYFMLSGPTLGKPLDEIILPTDLKLSNLTATGKVNVLGDLNVASSLNVDGKLTVLSSSFIKELVTSKITFPDNTSQTTASNPKIDIKTKTCNISSNPMLPLPCSVEFDFEPQHYMASISSVNLCFRRGDNKPTDHYIHNLYWSVAPNKSASNNRQIDVQIKTVISDNSGNKTTFCDMDGANKKLEVTVLATNF